MKKPQRIVKILWGFHYHQSIISTILSPLLIMSFASFQIMKPPTSNMRQTVFLVKDVYVKSLLVRFACDFLELLNGDYTYFSLMVFPNSIFCNLFVLKTFSFLLHLFQIETLLTRKLTRSNLFLKKETKFLSQGKISIPIILTHSFLKN